MPYEFEVELDAKSIRRASRRLMLRRVRAPLLILLVVTVLMVFAIFGWPWGLVGGLVLAALVIGMFAQIVYRRAAQTTANWLAMSGGSLHIIASEDYLQVRHDAIGMSIRWYALNSVVKLREIWLVMMYSGTTYVPLPLDQVPEDALTFIESEVAAHAPERQQRLRG
jgi:hypothetical protein